MKIKYQITLLIIIPLLLLSIFQIYYFNSSLNKIDEFRSNIVSPHLDATLTSVEIRSLTRQIVILTDKLMNIFNTEDNEKIISTIKLIRVKKDQRNSEIEKLKSISSKMMKSDLLSDLLFDVKSFINKGDLINEEILNLVEINLKQRDNLSNQLKTIKEKVINLEVIHEEQIKKVDLLYELELSEFKNTRNSISVMEKEFVNAIYFPLIIVFIIFVSIVFFINLTIIRSIENITETIIEISNGNLNVDVSSKDRKDEIGELANAFDRTIVSLKLAMKKLGGGETMNWEKSKKEFNK